MYTKEEAEAQRIRKGNKSSLETQLEKKDPTLPPSISTFVPVWTPTTERTTSSNEDEQVVLAAKTSDIRKNGSFQKIPLPRHRTIVLSPGPALTDPLSHFRKASLSCEFSGE